MQTFLPYSSFRKTAQSLDWRRLGKQRSETKQIVMALSNPFYGWRTARVYGKRSIRNVVSDVFLQPTVPVNRITLNVVISKPETVDETPVG